MIETIIFYILEALPAIISVVVIGFFQFIKNQLKKADADRKAATQATKDEVQDLKDSFKEAKTTIEHTQRDLLRDRLIQGMTNALEKGFCPMYQKQNFEAMYVDYHDYLHGNGAVTAMYESVMALPIADPKGERK